jgi:hypothetical protein
MVELFAKYLLDCGGVKCFHVLPVLKQPGGPSHWALRQGEDLEKGAVKDDQVLVDQLIAGNDIVIYRKTEQGADLVIVVIGQPLTVSRKHEEEIQEQFIMGEAGKKAASQKTVADPGEASIYLPDTVANKRFSIDHVPLQEVGKFCNWRPNVASRIPAGGNAPQPHLFHRKNGSEERLTGDIEAIYHEQLQVLKMHHPWFFQDIAFFAFVPLAGGPLCPLLSGDIVAGLSGGLLAGSGADRNHNSRPVLASSSGRYKKFCHTACMKQPSVR